jgi:peptidoglycan/LPS O-acetylase OafA/YrhL
MKKRNNAIDILRLIAAFLVVFIHMGIKYAPESTTEKTASVILFIARLAVPIFFAISGWFLYRGNKAEEVKSLAKQIPKLTKLLIIVLVGYIIVGKLLVLVLPEFGAKIFVLPNQSQLFEVLLGINGGSIGVMWYVLALIFIEIIYYLGLRFGKNLKPIVFIGVLGFLYTITTHTYFNSVNISGIDLTMSWITWISIFSLGYFLHKFYNSDFKHISTKSLVIFTVISFALFMYETILLSSGHPLKVGPYGFSTIFITTPLVIAGLILLTTRIKATSKFATILATAGRKYSLYIYIIHIVIIVGGLSRLLNKYDNFGLSPLALLVVKYTTTVSLSLGLAIAYVAVKNWVSEQISRKRR